MSILDGIVFNGTIRNSFWYGAPSAPRPPPSQMDLLLRALVEWKELLIEFAWVSAIILGVIVLWKVIGWALVTPIE